MRTHITNELSDQMLKRKSLSFHFISFHIDEAAPISFHLFHIDEAAINMPNYERQQQQQKSERAAAAVSKQAKKLEADPISWILDS